MADKDQLTKAWNLNRFKKEAEKKIHGRSGHSAIVTFDLKNFRIINMEYSYSIGNQVLTEISALLGLFVEGEEFYARIEADSFILFLDFEDKAVLISRISQLMRQIEHLGARLDLDIPFICMAGICVVESGQRSVENYIECANIARKSIKDYHKCSYAFFDREVEEKQNKDKYLASRMKSALKNNEFVVYYQPKVSIPDGKCMGLEALIRWKKEDGGLYRPDEFIPLFEKNGFIVEIDLFVFEQVCRQIGEWIRQGKKAYPVAVNISGVHLMEENFLERLIELTKQYQLPAGYIELEITETAFLNNASKVVEIAKEIKKEGFKLSMDDFGTGYSSLSLLKDLPVDIIKLDRDFFRKNMNRREKIIISNVIHMARQLEIQVISEGIETKEHEQFLKEIGCDFAQGYLYARPAPIEELESMLWQSSGECE